MLLTLFLLQAVHLEEHAFDEHSSVTFGPQPPEMPGFSSTA